MKGTYLDVGCAIGYASLTFCSTFSEIVNLDIRKTSVEKCKHNCQRTGLDASFIVADALNLPFRGSSFNVVSAFSLIEHLEDQSVFLKESNRVLMNRGIFLLQYPNGNFLVELHTGIFLPNLIPRKLFNLYCKNILKRQEIKVWNLTREKAIKICQPLFKHIQIEKCNYTERIVPPNFKFVYRLLKSFKVLEVFPLSWVFVCVKP